MIKEAKNILLALGGAILIDSFAIYKKANNIIRQVGTRDALQIASDLGIRVYYENYQDLLGMYTCRWKTRIIFLNNNLDDYMKQMVLAHEIGHDVFHRDLAVGGLREFTLFKMKNDTEYVANAFGRDAQSGAGTGADGVGRRNKRIGPEIHIQHGALGAFT